MSEHIPHEVYDPQEEIEMLARQNLQAKLQDIGMKHALDACNRMLDFVLERQIVIGRMGGKYRASTPSRTFDWADTPRDAVIIAMEDWT
jgi:hypothetical protein